MTKAEIQTYLGALNEEMKAKGLKGEIRLYGEAVMRLAFDARPATKDIGAVFQPASEIREAASRVAAKFNLPADWINDASKAFSFRIAKSRFWKWKTCPSSRRAPIAFWRRKRWRRAWTRATRMTRFFLIKRLNLKSPNEVFENRREALPEKSNQTRDAIFH